jgi:hypothetical protein
VPDRDALQQPLGREQHKQGTSALADERQGNTRLPGAAGCSPQR